MPSTLPQAFERAAVDLSPVYEFTVSLNRTRCHEPDLNFDICAVVQIRNTRE